MTIEKANDKVITEKERLWNKYKERTRRAFSAK